MTFLEDYCARQQQEQAVGFGNDNGEHDEDWSQLLLSESSKLFLQKLGLPLRHPLCDRLMNHGGHEGARTDVYVPETIPAMGPLTDFAYYGDENNLFQAFITWLYMTVPPYLTFVGLWAKLLAGIFAPLGILWLLVHEDSSCFSTSHHRGAPATSNNMKKLTPLEQRRFTMVTLGSTVSALLVMTDSLYVYEYGASYGITLFLLSMVLSIKACYQRGLPKKLYGMFLALMLVASFLTFDASSNAFQFGVPTDVNVDFAPGLYYDQQNQLINATVSQYWPEQFRTYSPANGATRWMYTGDARTGLPFFLNRVTTEIHFVRVFLPVEADEEVIAVDIAFPPGSGYNKSGNVYLVLHGVNGGSVEPYVLDLVERRIREGDTVAVMVSRGLMDLPLMGFNTFHAARWSDAHETAMALRKAMEPGQMLAGVGYSMGAIVLANYVASSGTKCELDAAFSISGALECRIEAVYERPKLYWQPMIADYIRERSLNNYGNRMKAKLSREDFIALHRATNVVEMDQYTAVSYNDQFDNLTHFYAESGALGDFSMDELESDWPLDATAESTFPSKRIFNVSIPLCVLHALDDPISTWRTNAANAGVMRPENLVKTGNGNVLLLLTGKGGHVGWPVGWIPFHHNWKFMNEAASSFVDAVRQAKASRKTQLMMS